MEINNINDLHHAYLPDSVAMLVTLIKNLFGQQCCHGSDANRILVCPTVLPW